MRKFISGMLFGIFITAIIAYRYAEKIVTTKQKISENKRKRGTPLLGIYKSINQKRLFISPQEAAFIPAENVVYETPTKQERAQKPGFEQEPSYNDAFYKYILNRKLTYPEAWKAFQTDYPDEIVKKHGPGYTKQLEANRKRFIEAMRRRSKALTKQK